MTTHETDTTLNSCLLLFSLQFKSRGGQGAGAARRNVRLTCGQSLSNAAFFGPGHVERRAANIHGLK